MHVMRCLKSIASGRSSFSDPSGDSGAKRAKFDREGKGKMLAAPESVEDNDVALHQPMPAASLVVDTSKADIRDCGHTGKNEDVGVEQLPKEMHEMKLTDDKVDHQDDKSAEATVISGNGTEAGRTIKITIGGENGQPKRDVSYVAKCVVGTGSFGVVYQVKCPVTSERFVIKKVLQDRRYRNRELQIMKLRDHPNVVKLMHCSVSTNEKDELYLNLVLEYVAETVYQVSRHYNRMNQRMPIIYVQLYTYQILGWLTYIHGVLGVCHGDKATEFIGGSTHSSTEAL